MYNAIYMKFIMYKYITIAQRMAKGKNYISVRQLYVTYKGICNMIVIRYRYILKTLDQALEN